MAGAIDAVVKARQRTAPPRVAWVGNTQEQISQAHAAIDMIDGLRERIHFEAWCAAGAPKMTVWRPDIVIVDEVHHLGASQWLEIIEGYSGALWGCSATPFGEDEDRNELLRTIFENQIFEVTRADVANRVLHGRVVMLDESDEHDLRALIDEEIEAQLTKRMCRFSVFFPPENKIQWVIIAGREQPDLCKGLSLDINLIRRVLPARIVKEIDVKLFEAVKARSWAQCAYLAVMQLGIIPNRRRNTAIVRTARHHLRNPEDTVIILVYSIKHGEALAAEIPGAVVIHSKMGKKARREAMAALQAGTLRCVFATSLMDEGFDCPRANVLIQAGAGRSSRAAEQRTGRVLRVFGEQTHGTIYDFEDKFHPLSAKQSKKRQELYRSLGYSITTAAETQQPALI